MKHCQLCGSGRIKLSNDIMFCENCEIYFAIKNTTQLIKSLPITETKQRSLCLCPTCTKRAMKPTITKCRFFKEYLRKLPFCRSCKSINRDFLKNLFFKNFLLYKKTRKVFGFTTLLVLLISWLISKPLLFPMYYYIEFSLDNLSLKKLVLTSLIFYNIIPYSFARDILFLICLYKIVFSRRTLFEIPINLLDPRELDSFINRLSIRGDSGFRSESEISKRTRII